MFHILFITCLFSRKALRLMETIIILCDVLNIIFIHINYVILLGHILLFAAARPVLSSVCYRNK